MSLKNVKNVKKRIICKNIKNMAQSNILDNSNLNDKRKQLKLKDRKINHNRKNNDFRKRNKPKGDQKEIK